MGESFLSPYRGKLPVCGHVIILYEIPQGALRSVGDFPAGKSRCVSLSLSNLLPSGETAASVRGGVSGSVFPHVVPSTSQMLPSVPRHVDTAMLLGTKATTRGALGHSDVT